MNRRPSANRYSLPAPGQKNYMYYTRDPGFFLNSDRYPRDVQTVRIEDISEPFRSPYRQMQRSSVTSLDDTPYYGSIMGDLNDLVRFYIQNFPLETMSFLFMSGVGLLALILFCMMVILAYLLQPIGSH